MVAPSRLIQERMKLHIFFRFVTQLIFIFSIIFFGVEPVTTFAQNTSTETLLEAKVITILAEEYRTFDTEYQQLYQKLELEIVTAERQGERITVENGTIPLASVVSYKQGDLVVVSEQTASDGVTAHYITDYVRRPALLYLFVLFLVLSILIGKLWGVTSLLGMMYSFFIIIKVIIPQIINGRDPVLVAIIGAIAIIPATFYLSHGLNKKTTISIIGTISSLIVTGILANIFVSWAHLSGLASDEAQFLQIFRDNSIDMRGLLLAGIIIGTLGVLDDITISQAALVEQLKGANPKMSLAELTQRAMSVGRDHISSLINTLFLVYTGAALPLLILFVDNPQPLSQILNLELIAEEIVRTLVGTVGIVLAVPITTLLAAFIYQQVSVSPNTETHHHH